MKALSIAALSAGLLIGGSAAAFAADRGGIMTYGRYADSMILDPVQNDANVDIWVLSNIYDTLLLPTDDGQGVKPGLATEWSVSDDGLTVTLKLRDGIRFSDGSPIMATDVEGAVRSLRRNNRCREGTVVFATSRRFRPLRSEVLGTRFGDEARQERVLLGQGG